MKNKLFLILLFIAVAVFFIAPAAFSQSGSLGGETATKTGEQLESARSLSTFAPTPSGGLVSIIVAVIRMSLLIVGAVFLAMLVYGGYSWMTAGGNEESLKKAKSTVVNAVIGIGVVLLSLSITLAINYLLLESTTESGTYIGVGVSGSGVDLNVSPGASAPSGGTRGWLWGN